MGGVFGDDVREGGFLVKSIQGFDAEGLGVSRRTPHEITRYKPIGGKYHVTEDQ